MDTLFRVCARRMVDLQRSVLDRLAGFLPALAFIAGSLAPAATTLAATFNVPGQLPTIASALERAQAGDRVLLAPGTYAERGLVLPAGVTLAGDGEAPADVVLNGQGAGRILACENFARTSEIRNLTFVGGRADGMTLHDASGGALLINHAAVSVVDCVFRANSAASNGGAVWVFEASPTFSGCVFDGNVAGSGGGGLDCTLYASPSLQNCRFVDNRADWGAGLSCRDYSSPVVMSTIFSGNATAGERGYGGGAFCDLESKPMFFGCTFAGNEAKYGGALANFADSGATLVRCTLVGNVGTWRGAGIYSRNAATSVSASIIAFHQGTGLFSGGTYGPQLNLSNVFGNAGGDWVGSAAPGGLGATNRSGDPLFCANSQPTQIAFNLQEASPCHPDSNGGTTLGAWPVGCGSPLPSTLTLNADWIGGLAQLTWRLPDGLGVVPAFRLTGARAAEPELSWEVPFTQQGNGTYAAEDPASTLQGEGPFVFRLYAAFGAGTWTLMAQATLDVERVVPAVTNVLAAPNPFNPSTTVNFRLGRAQRVRVSVYDLDGRLIARLADAEFPAGANSVTWTGRDDGGRSLSSGTYLVLVDSPGRQVTTKVTLLK